MSLPADVPRPDDGLLTLYDVAQRLGVHYMTAYRYVRTGRLPGRKAGVEWRVEPADLDAFVAAGGAGAANTAGPAGPAGVDGGADRRRRRVDRAGRLMDRLVAGDEPGAWAVVQSAMASGTGPAEVYLDLIVPALEGIGDAWSAGTITVSQEHRASGVVHRLIGRLGPQFARRGRTRGTVVLGAPAGDRHALPSALFADLLRGEGFSVIDLGSDTPAPSFVEAAAGAERLVAVGITATAPDNEAAVAAVVDAVRGAVDTTVVLGGGASSQATAERLGADHWGGQGRDALALFAGLADDAGRRRRRPSRREAP